ncbi:MAG: efflux RND transporter periplasmic adaptor subunit [Oscillospiraceae bacterium]|nr:efflux RND transporter periplasmic adaptor subunit [Oscillospiraceae bacterium]
MEQEELQKEEVTESTDKPKKKSKAIGFIILILLIAGGVILTLHLIGSSGNYLTTDNARVTTTLAPITANIPGTLERFTIYEGRRVAENEVIGWVENGESIRAPFEGKVILTNVVQEQRVSLMEPLAVIADANALHIQANIYETDINKVQVGQFVTLTIDPYGNRQFSGYVAEIGAITQAELSGTAMFFNTAGTFTRVTQLIPIKINVEDDVDLASIIGASATVRIRISQDA